MLPKVSVITPCFNESSEVFRRSLESVVNQTLKGIEIIIVLDKPENSELKGIIEEYRQKYSNIVALYPEKNLGRGMARNLGIENASGKYIAIHDADDVDNLNRLLEQFDFMEQNPEMSVLFSGVDFMNSSGEKYTTYHINTIIPSQHPSIFRRGLHHQTMFIKKEVIQRFYYKDMNYGEDVDLWIRLFLDNQKFGYIDAVHSSYLIPEENTSEDFEHKMKQWKIVTFKILLDYYSDLYKDRYYYRLFLLTVLDYGALSVSIDFFKFYRKTLFSFLVGMRKLFGRKISS